VLFNPNLNYPEHIKHVPFYVSGMKSQELESGGFEPALPFDVRPKLVSMAIPINFDNKPQLGQ
jgi:hypothetical protein